MHCPQCGACRYESNRIEEAPFVIAARDAEQLCYFGDYEAAALVLDALSRVRIANFIRARWRCLECQSRFDD